MTGEVIFYQLTGIALENALPDLATRSLEKGWRVFIRAAEATQLALLDDMLWVQNQGSFLPHGMAEAPGAAAQPILLGTGTKNLNRADVLMLVEGARLAVGEVGDYTRACVIFNGNEPGALQNARDDWRAAQTAGLACKYWADEGGRWVQKAG